MLRRLLSIACLGLLLPVDAAVAAQAKPAWQQEWEKTLEAAKREGQVVIYISGYDAVLQDFVDFYVAESRARSRWVRRVRVVAFLAAFVPLLVCFFLVSAALGEQPWWIDLAIVLASALVCLALYQQAWFRVRTWRGLRPRFRAPVPGARGAARLDEPGGL